MKFLIIFLFFLIPVVLFFIFLISTIKKFFIFSFDFLKNTIFKKVEPKKKTEYEILKEEIILLLKKNILGEVAKQRIQDGLLSLDSLYLENKEESLVALRKIKAELLSFSKKDKHNIEEITEDISNLIKGLKR